MNSSSGAMEWIEVTSCPLCESDIEQHVPFEEVFERSEQIHFRMCRRCGFVFQSPRMSEHARGAYYEGAYRIAVQEDEGPTDKDLRVQNGRALHLVRYLAEHLDTVNRHLDIGSSAGTLLRAVRARFGAEGIGIEPGAAYRDYSAQHGSNTVPDLDDLKSQRFDLITMAHVLEHISNPVDYLMRLRAEYLEEGGTLLVEVPNLFGHQALEMSHDTAFSSQTLRETLRKAGFEVADLKVHGEPRSRILGLYLIGLGRASLPPGDNREVRSGSQIVRLRRRIGNMRRRILTRIMPGLAWLPYSELEFAE